MIKANELRIGNLAWWVKEEGQRKRRVRVIGKSDFDAGEFLDPIPLTPELLEKAGAFKYNGKCAGYAIYAGYVGNDPIADGVLPTLILDRNFMPRNFLEHPISPDLAVIEHLHQLQNLYFALTGEELAVTV